MADFHRRLAPTARVRGVVDTAPLLERHFGQLAGLGWIGKNTMLINERFGSWLFLAALLTHRGIGVRRAGGGDHCGSCRACLDACPTGALMAPHRLDARKCLSYLTIESRGPLPAEFRAACGGRLFGCDACQEACPWNRRTPSTAEPAFQPGPGMNPVDLGELVSMDEAAFRRRFRHTPLWRAKREGILRNAAAVVRHQSRYLATGQMPPLKKILKRLLVGLLRIVAGVPIVSLIARRAALSRSGRDADGTKRRPERRDFRRRPVLLGRVLEPDWFKRIRRRFYARAAPAGRCCSTSCP